MNTEQPEPETMVPPSPVTSSVWSRLVNVLVTPGEVFDEICAAPPAISNWLVPALLLIVVGWLGSALVLNQPQVQQQLSDLRTQAIQKRVDRGQLTQEQANQATAAAERYAGISQNISAAVAPVFGAFVVPFWWGLILWVVGAKILKGQFHYMKAVEVAGLANVVLIFQGIVKTLLIVITGNVFASASIGFLLWPHYDPTNPLHGLLAALDLFTFWVLAVRGIGLARLSRASAGVSWAWVFGIWLVVTGGFVGAGALLSRIFG